MPAAFSSSSPRVLRPQTATTGTPGLGRGGRDAGGGLAAQRLLVQRALAGDHQAGALDVVVEAEQVEQVVDARPELGRQEGQRGEAHAAGGARARLPGHAHRADDAVVLDGARQAVGVRGDGGEPGEGRGRAAVTSSGVAPFCGPYTAAAPCGPSSGLSTSLATTTSTSPISMSPEMSIFSRLRRAAPPNGSSCPSASRKRTPSACIMPAPPSVQALPPRPSTIRRAPCRTAWAISSPVP